MALTFLDHVMYGHATEVEAELQARPRSATELGALLIHTVIPNRPDMTRVLLAAGALPTKACAAVGRATELRREPIVADLIRAGAHMTPAHVRMALGWNAASVTLALLRAAPQAATELLVTAAGDGNVESVRVLLDANANGDAGIDQALAAAARVGHHGVLVRLLLERGANAATLDLGDTRQMDAFRAGLDAGAARPDGLLALVLQADAATSDARAWKLVQRGIGWEEPDAVTHARSKRVIMGLLRRGAAADPEACRVAKNPVGADIVRAALGRAEARRLFQARGLLQTLLPLDLAELIVQKAMGALASLRTRYLYKELVRGAPVHASRGKDRVTPSILLKTV